MKEEGLLGTGADWGAEPLLDGAAGWEKVNSSLPPAPLVAGSVSVCGRPALGKEMEGAAAGWEKLKSRPLGPLLSMLATAGWAEPKASGPAAGWELLGSGLTLKMGLNRASSDGLKLNSDVPNPRL